MVQAMAGQRAEGREGGGAEVAPDELPGSSRGRAGSRWEGMAGRGRWEGCPGSVAVLAVQRGTGEPSDGEA